MFNFFSQIKVDLEQKNHMYQKTLRILVHKLRGTFSHFLMSRVSGNPLIGIWIFIQYMNENIWKNIWNGMQSLITNSQTR